MWLCAVGRRSPPPRPICPCIRRRAEWLCHGASSIAFRARARGGSYSVPRKWARMLLFWFLVCLGRCQFPIFLFLFPFHHGRFPICMNAFRFPAPKLARWGMHAQKSRGDIPDAVKHCVWRTVLEVDFVYENLQDLTTTDLTDLIYACRRDLKSTLRNASDQVSSMPILRTLPSILPVLSAVVRGLSSCKLRETRLDALYRRTALEPVKLAKTQTRTRQKERQTSAKSLRWRGRLEDCLTEWPSAHLHVFAICLS